MIKRSKERVKQTAEVFTPASLVNQMLSKLPKEVWAEGKTFCDPACGTGNFLIAILWKKIEQGHNITECIKTLFGADIMKDNILECRLRLLKIISLYEEVTEEHVKSVLTNIAWINQETQPKGSLDYDFSFLPNYKEKDVKIWLTFFQHKQVDLPVYESRLEPSENLLYQD